MKPIRLTFESISRMRGYASLLVTGANYISYHSEQYLLCMKLATQFHAYGINVSIRSEWLENCTNELVSLYMAYYKPDDKSTMPSPVSSFAYFFYDEKDTKKQKRDLLHEINKFLYELENYLKTKL